MWQSKLSNLELCLQKHFYKYAKYFPVLDKYFVNTCHFQEAEIMKKFSHPHLVAMYAVCTEQEPFYIITE